jgi:hypothetical protein
LALRGFDLLGRIDFAGTNREVGAIHTAQITTAALFRMHNVRWMVALGIKSGGKREDVGGAKLHTETAGFTALDDDGNTSLCHEISTLKVELHTKLNRL